MISPNTDLPLLFGYDRKSENMKPYITILDGQLYLLNNKNNLIPHMINITYTNVLNNELGSGST